MGKKPVKSGDVKELAEKLKRLNSTIGVKGDLSE